MMTDKIEITPFDAADYLDSEEAIAEYLDAIMEENPALYNAAMQDVEKARQRLAVTNVQAPIALAAQYCKQLTSKVLTLCGILHSDATP